MIKAFIFDLDGVITDTAEFHFRGWKQLADEEKIPFTRADNEHLRGVSRRDSLLLLLEGRNLPEEKMQEMMRRKNDYYLRYINEMTPADLLPGARELLMEIRAAGLRNALGSASRNAPLVLKLLGIPDLFDVVADGSHVANQKPAPDIFLYAAKGLDLPPAECVVVEDAAAGIEAALAGGFRTMGLGPSERVGKAELILPSLENVRLADLQKYFDSGHAE